MSFDASAPVAGFAIKPFAYVRALTDPPVNDWPTYMNSAQVAPAPAQMFSYVRNTVTRSASSSLAETDEIGVLGKYQDYHRELQKTRTEAWQGFCLRFGALQREAAFDDVIPNSLSEMDAISFAKGLHFSKRPALFLRDNGVYSMAWRGPSDQRLSIDFLGDGQVTYVASTRAPGAKRMSRVAGTVDISQLMAMLKAVSADQLLA